MLRPGSCTGIVLSFAPLISGPIWWWWCIHPKEKGQALCCIFVVCKQHKNYRYLAHHLALVIPLPCEHEEIGGKGEGKEEEGRGVIGQVILSSRAMFLPLDHFSVRALKTAEVRENTFPKTIEGREGKRGRGGGMNERTSFATQNTFLLLPPPIRQCKRKGNSLLIFLCWQLLTSIALNPKRVCCLF